MKDYNKSYATDGERLKRFEIFVDNFELIAELNEKSNGTTEFGINHLADLVSETT